MNLRVELWDSNEWKDVYSVEICGKINDDEDEYDVCCYWNDAITDFLSRSTMFEGKKFQIKGPFWFRNSSVDTIDNKQEE